VQIIPYTFAHTSLGTARAGDAVNIEVDVLGKYVARLLASDETSASREAMPLRP
jgi:riboflavin synthase